MSLDLTELLKSANLPAWLLVAVVVLAAVLVVIHQYTGSERRLLWPTELRRRDRIKHLHQLLEITDDVELKKVVSENLEVQIFWEATGIAGGPQLRECSSTLYESSRGRYGWQGIAEALPYIKRDREGRLVKGLDWLTKIMMYLLMATAAISLIGTVLLIILISKMPGNMWEIAQLMVFPMLAFLTAGWLFNLSIPMLRASQLQRWLPNPHAPQPMPPTPTQQPSTVSTAPVDNSR